MDVKKKILIIDDEVDISTMIAFQLTSKGFEVQMAKDGLEGLSQATVFRPDLIILDMNMPRMGGIEFYSKITGPNGRPIFPVMVLTARANVQDLFKDLEIDGFMIKPFEIDHLITEVESIIENRCKRISKSGEGLLARPRKIAIVENDQEIFGKVSGIFLNADYTVIPAKNGMSGIEKIKSDMPDVALVQLALKDISGDIVIFRLSQDHKINCKFVLYTSRDFTHHREVMERISIKTGIYTFVEYKELSELLREVNQLF